jgi:phosphate transport system substrate-binding protein
MPHQLPHPRPRRPQPNVVIPAAGTLALLAVALTACTSTSTGSAQPVSATASGAPANAVRISGAGSTFDAPFFGLAFTRYQQQHPGVAISYSSVGSSAGIAAFTANKADFGASDVPMTAAQQAAAHGGASVQVPVDLGAEAIAYNLVGLPRLQLTGPVIARIFLGQITNWNDPAIAALNPHTVLPNAPIFVVHRADGSGTTYIFSNYLSSVDPTWAAKAGTGTTLHWPAPDGEGVQGNAGVADAVAHIPYSIGYIERSYVQGPILAKATIRHQAGQYTSPTPASIAADAAQKPSITPTDFSIVNEPGATSYPISGYSWALIYTHQTSQATGQALVNLLNWLTHNGQANAATLGYVPLPPRIQQLAHTMLQQITGPSGTHVLS